MSAALVKPNHKIGILVAILTCIVFGVYPAAIRAAYADGANVVFILWLTMFTRAFMLSTFALLKRRPLMAEKEHRRTTLLAGFWQAVSVTGVLGGVAFIVILYGVPWRNQAGFCDAFNNASGLVGTDDGDGYLACSVRE